METSFEALRATPARIQTASWRDLLAVRQLEEVCFPVDSWPLLEIVGVLTLPGMVRLKAVTSKQMVGFVAGDFHKDEDMAWIATIGVLPEFRGRGIGMALLQACETRLMRPRVRLCVRASNQPAIQLYLRAGYQQVGVWHRYYQDGEEALVFEKQH